MKFAHLADCHIGGWHESKLKELGIKSFSKAIDSCIEHHVGFVLIAGDLFDTALPSIDLIKETALILNKLKEYDIPVYIIPGSHDFSASGKTMLDVLENSGLVHNVMKFESENKLKFSIDKTNTKISGFYGKKGSLEFSEYDLLLKDSLEQEPGFKIFMFHSLLEELKQGSFQLIEALSLNKLPKNFNYYAGGHPHFVRNKSFENYNLVAYPGPTFPNNFQELEDLKCGGFYIIEIIDNELKLNYIKLDLVPVLSFTINAENKSPKNVEQEIVSSIKDFENKIITLRIEGCLSSGKTSDINFKNIQEHFETAYCFLKNTNKLTTKDFQEIEISYSDTIDIEGKIISEHSVKSKYKEDFIKALMQTLDKEKGEGERVNDFELRIIKDSSQLLKL